MTLTEFINTWNGKYLDYDGGFGPQCVDVAKAWCHELGLDGLRGNAIDWPKNASDKLIWINNTPDNIPRAGDLIIWNMGPYGHIAVFVDGDVFQFNSFDQNYPVGTFCHIQNHNYSNVIGWLHPVTLDQTGDIMSEEPTIQAQLTACNKTVDALRAKNEDRKEQIAKLQEEIALKNAKIVELEKRPLSCPDIICDCDGKSASELIALGIRKWLGIK